MAPVEGRVSGAEQVDLGKMGRTAGESAPHLPLSGSEAVSREKHWAQGQGTEDPGDAQMQKVKRNPPYPCQGDSPECTGDSSTGQPGGGEWDLT